MQMNKVIIILILLALFAIAIDQLFFKETQPVVSPADNQTNPEKTEVKEEQQTAPNQKLFELKSSIQGVIEDSIQDDIQEAVQSEINKTDSTNN